MEKANELRPSCSRIFAPIMSQDGTGVCTLVTRISLKTVEAIQYSGNEVMFLVSLRCTKHPPLFSPMLSLQASCYPSTVTVLMLSFHCNEQPLLYWCFSPTSIIVSFHYTDVIPTVLMFSLNCTDVILLQLSIMAFLLCSLYWCFSSSVLNNLNCTPQTSDITPDDIT